MPRGLHAKSLRNAETLEAKQKILLAKYKHDLKMAGRTLCEADKASLGRLVALQLLLESLDEKRLAGHPVDDTAYFRFIREFQRLMKRLFPPVQVKATTQKTTPPKPVPAPYDPWECVVHG
jgi:hypothetical protein